ncbi:DinB family protein [Flavobacterium selenitireducens]|uniref:DinB family protein n=1 Tax=Flavobacterium selenitireducens TaxID=2722704 RepID=UPI00168B1F6A|nr:DinB family protein [Flavobacterium selenitireducens]MBD3581059.1 DinB family protein [Flavobacterium selenitireducens]
MKPSQLRPDEYPAYQKTYLDTVDEIELVEELEISLHRFIRFVREIPMDKFDYRYAPGKWTIKEIIQHIIDTERVFGYRALAFARNDKTPLPGFEENDYADEAGGNARHLNSLLTELSEVRQSNITLFKSFSDEMLMRVGNANGMPSSVRSLGFAIIGHQNHHQNVYRERYLG